MPRPPAAGALVGFVLCAAVYVAYNGPGRTANLGRHLTDPRATNSDFFQNWAAAVDFAGGGSIYRPLRVDFARFQDRLGPVYGPDERSPNSGMTGPGEEAVLAVNAHPPFATLLALPSASYSYSAAYHGFNWIGVALLGATVGILLAGGIPGGPTWTGRAILLLPLAVFVAASAPLQTQFQVGNWNCLLLFLLTAGWRLASAGRPGAAGAVVGIAALVKLFPGLVVLAFLPRGRRSGLVGFAVAVAAGTALTVAVFGVGMHIAYVREVIPLLRMQTSVFNLSIPAMAGRLFDPTQPFIVPLVRSKLLLVVWVAVWGALILGPLVWRFVRRGVIGTDGLYAATVTAAVVLSPVAYGHNLLLVLLPAWIVLLDSMRRRDHLAPAVLALAGCVLWLGTAEVHAMLRSGGDQVPYSPWETLTVLSAQTYAVLIVHILACRVAFSEPAATLPPAESGTDKVTR